MTVHEIVTRKFDRQARNWSQDPQINMLFLRTMQSFFNDVLMSRGHVFLNEVYDELGMSRTSQGAISGWFKGPIVLWNPELEADEDGAIALVFVTEGIIYDKIEES
jgi:hypothetical protein